MKENDLKELVRFVLLRQNKDGGYGFAPKYCGLEFPSAVSDTFYALAVLDALNQDFLERERTLSYLHGIQSVNGTYDNIAVAFYAVKALEILRKKPARMEFTAQLREALEKTKWHGGESFSSDYDASSSPLKYQYYAAKALRICDFALKMEHGSWVLSPNKDGGFGKGNSDITTTYHALQILSLTGHQIGDFQSTAEFVERCAWVNGGFCAVPNSTPAYLESTYFGIMCCKLLGIPLDKWHEETTLEYIENMQNLGGGFRRSPFMGISTLNNSYLAVKSLEELGALLG